MYLMKNAGFIPKGFELMLSQRMYSTAARTVPNLFVTKSFLIPTIRLSPTLDLNDTISELNKKVTNAPLFFKNAPVVIDLQDTPNIDVHYISQLKEELRKISLLAIGVTNASKSIQESKQSIPILNSPVGNKGTLQQQSQPSEPLEAVVRSTPKSDKEPVASSGDSGEHPTTKSKSKVSTAKVGSKAKASDDQEKLHLDKETTVIKGSIRSGQQVYASGGDLVVMGNVSSGAEVLADGNIHIYGTLRGRALCGLRGDLSCQIFCGKLDPELISIADSYISGDEIPKLGTKKPVSVSYDPQNNKIMFSTSQEY